jgi:pimeloyl-ACP methyl ester carboxylesterase
MIQKSRESVARAALLLCGLLFALSAGAQTQTKWRDLPATPTLPQAAQSGFANVGGVHIWFASYGETAHPAVVLLHGGSANSSYWGHLVRDLASQYRVIVVDSRGHGRSHFGGKPFSYAAMADDVVAVLDHLKIDKAAVVGWSDGANVGLYLTLKYPKRISGHYAFAGNSNPGGMQAAPPNGTFPAFVARARAEFSAISPVSTEAAKINAALSLMWRTQPQLTTAELKKVTVPTWIVHAEHDEVIRRAHAQEIAASVPGAKFVLLKGVSHFALLQDPAQFSGSVHEFLRGLR